MSFKRTFFKNISTFAVYNYMTQGTEFLATIILSRLLLPEEYGFVAIIYIFVGFIRLFANLGVGVAVVRSDYRYTYHKHLLSLAIWLGFTLSVTLSLLSYPIAIFFNNMALILPTIVISIKFIFDSFTIIPFAILSKELNFNIVGKIRFFGTGVQIVFMIIFAYLGFSYWSLIIPIIFNPIVQYLLLRKKVALPLKVYGWRATKRMAYKIRSLMGNLSLNNLVRYWSNHADKVVIGRLYTQADLGLYNRAFRFIKITNQLVTGIFSSVLFPSLKKLMEEKGNANSEFLDIIRIITLFNLPIVAILVVFPETLVNILWGQEWTGVAQFLPYVGIVVVYNSIISTMSSVFLLYGKERNLFLINLVNSVITILLVIIGGMFSIMHIIRFLTLGYIFFIIPINIYFGFYRSFKFKPKKMLRFWIPSLIFGMLLLPSIYYSWNQAKWIVLLVYFVFLLYELKSSVIGSLKFLQYKLSRRH
ncbi:MAG: oligosaccharide flippase family protein [Bacteroidota bacterium]